MATLSVLAEHRASANIEEQVPDHAIEKAPAAGRLRRSALLLRFALLNLLAFALLGAAIWEGYIDKVISADKTRLSIAIFVVFIAGLLISAWRAWQISREIDDLSEDKLDAAAAKISVTASLRLKLTQRIASVRHIANTLVLLGLIGTVLGFIIALSGVDPNTAGDVNSIAPMVSVLIQGMSTALYTTLIGSVLNVWLMANYQVLTGGTVQLMSLWLDRTEKNA